VTTLPPCAASWSSPTRGRCDRPAKLHELCQAHYQQQRRGRAFTQLRDPGRVLVQVVIQIPEEDAATLASEAAARQIPLAEVYREAVAPYAARLRRR
jgi:hypothetical protein